MRNGRTMGPAKRRKGRLGAVVTLTGLLVLGGCQHQSPNMVQPLTPPVAGGPAARPRLTESQVADVQVALGRSMEKAGCTQQAMAAYLEALRHDPNRADACLRLAVLRDQEGKFKESLELYRRALAAQPGSADIYCDMGYSLYLQSRFGEAEMNLRQAIAIQPGHQRAHNNLGLVLARAGRADEALAEFRQAGCSGAEAHCNLAFALLLEHNGPEARQHYEQALAANPKSLLARKGLQELDRMSTRREIAAEQPHVLDLAQAKAAAPAN